ncbi:hypothetical protein RG2014_073 [Delftia phage RG-2014]|uniref:Uncharacterized protein n=1 Tax=Delftia phage RG-2014 TaxID=1563661 RepID=A0A097PAM7_9CAUD|nr:hypothetical protein RG2014_073 [Delftia phage RG-2014]AIU44327.1 hypothetical protein RG2014_073 [Delftia phage RG-2014]
MDHSNVNTEAAQQVDELAHLKQKATMLGISFSNNISVDTLRKRINDHLGAQAAEEAEEQASVAASFEAQAEAAIDARLGVDAGKAEASPSGSSPTPAKLDDPKGLVTRSAELDKHLHTAQPQTMADLRAAVAAKPRIKDTSLAQLLRDEQMVLVRCRISVMNPAKQNLPGEFHTISNRVLGTVRMFVPYGEATENGWHIPLVMFNHLKSKRYLQVRFGKKVNGIPVVDNNFWPREFNIEVLDPLTPEQLKQLGKAQIAAGTSQVG